MSRLADRSELHDLHEVATAFAVQRLGAVRTDLEAHDRLGASIVAAVVDAGLWSIGIAEDAGGQGGDLRATLVAVAALAETSPAVAIAVVHNHAAAAALAAVGEAGLVQQCTASAAAMAAAVTTGEHGGDVVISRLDRGLGATTVVLADPVRGDLAVVGDDALDAGPPLRRSGLGGLGTTRATAPATTAWRRDPAAAEAVARWWALGGAAVAIGITRSARRLAGDYLRERSQFGTTLASLPTLAAALDRLQDRARAAEAVVSAAVDGEGDASTVAARAAAKAVHTSFDAVQLHGGYGYLKEYPVEGLARDAVSLRAALAAWSPAVRG